MQEIRAQIYRLFLYLQRNISKLYDSYLFVSNMVYDQGAMVDRVEHHINSSCDYVEKGTIGLKKAKQLRDKYRTKKVILTILVLVLIGLVILIIAMNMPHENDHKSEVATTEHHGSGHWKISSGSHWVFSDSVNCNSSFMIKYAFHSYSAEEFLTRQSVEYKVQHVVYHAEKLFYLRFYIFDLFVSLRLTSELHFFVEAIH